MHKLIGQFIVLSMLFVVALGLLPNGNLQYFTEHRLALTSIFLTVIGLLWAVVVSLFGVKFLSKMQAMHAIKTWKPKSKSFTTRELTWRGMFGLMIDLDGVDYWPLWLNVFGAIDSDHGASSQTPNHSFDITEICFVLQRTDNRIKSFDRMSDNGYLNKVKTPKGFTDQWGKVYGNDVCLYVIGQRLAIALNIECDCQSLKARGRYTSLEEMTIEYKSVSIGCSVSRPY